MHRLNFIIIFLACCFTSGCGSHHRIKEILSEAYDVCQAIEAGHCSFEKYFTILSQADSTYVTQQVAFVKKEDETIFGYHFDSHITSSDFGSINLAYDGEAAAMYSNTHRTGNIMYANEMPNEIYNTYLKNPALSSYWPLMTKNSYPLNKALFGDMRRIKMNREAFVEQYPCYHIIAESQTDLPDAYSHMSMYIKNVVYEYWIDKSSYLPRQFSIRMDFVVNGKVHSETEIFRLKEFDLCDIAAAKVGIIPEDIILSEVEQYLWIESHLEVGYKAPDAVFRTIDGDSVTLSQTESEFIILDFFITGCPPCIKNVPYLNELYLKYDEKTLTLYGVIPDNWDKDLDNFLRTNHVKYQVVKAESDLFKTFEVHGYPTIYLLDNDLNVLYYHRGEFAQSDIFEIRALIENN